MLDSGSQTTTTALTPVDSGTSISSSKNEVISSTSSLQTKNQAKEIQSDVSECQPISKLMEREEEEEAVAEEAETGHEEDTERENVVAITKVDSAQDVQEHSSVNDSNSGALPRFGVAVPNRIFVGGIPGEVLLKAI